MPGIDEIADSLYGLPPEQFTAARTQYEKEAKAAGDRDAAARIHAMAKPSVPAWLANQLAREHRDELQPLLALGAELRDATRNLAGDQLRTLSRQQHQLVYALVQQARKLARAADRSVSDDAARGLEETLHAALADEHAASLLLAGRLTEALHSSGFDSGLADTAETATNVIPLHSRRTSGNSAGRRQPREEERRRAEQDLIEAQRALADATAALDDARGMAAAADQAAATAQERIDELHQQLVEATSAASDADRRREEQTRALRRAELAVRDAERRSVAAQDRRDRVVGDGSGGD
jgi:chromosome segregation ATPase